MHSVYFQACFRLSCPSYVQRSCLYVKNSDFEYTADLNLTVCVVVTLKIVVSGYCMYM